MLSNCKINNYQILEQLGSGGYGFVYHVKDTLTDKDYAMKIIVKSTFNNINQDTFYHSENIKNSNNTDNNPTTNITNNNNSDSKFYDKMLKDEISHFFISNNNNLLLPIVDLNTIRTISYENLQKLPYYREISLHLKVQEHKNIVTIHNVMESATAIFVIMDYYPFDLFNAIVNDQIFKDNGTLIKKVFLQICSAIKYCHDFGIYHCDIKPENILFDPIKENILLCDFGLSITSNILTPNVAVGSSYYMAPERIYYYNNNYNDNNNNVHHHGQYHEDDTMPTCPTYKADIWSLGIILINLTCIRNPWLKANQMDDATFGYFTKDPKILQKILPISDDLFNLLIQILKFDPIYRIDINDLMDGISNITSFTTMENMFLNKVDKLTENQFIEFICVNENYSLAEANYLFDKQNKHDHTDNDVNDVNNIDTDEQSTLYSNIQFNTNNVTTTANNNGKTIDDISTINSEIRYDASTVNSIMSTDGNTNYLNGRCPSYR